MGLPAGRAALADRLVQQAARIVRVDTIGRGGTVIPVLYEPRHTAGEAYGRRGQRRRVPRGKSTLAEGLRAEVATGQGVRSGHPQWRRTGRDVRASYLAPLEPGAVDAANVPGALDRVERALDYCGVDRL